MFISVFKKCEIACIEECSAKDDESQQYQSIGNLSEQLRKGRKSNVVIIYSHDFVHWKTAKRIVTGNKNLSIDKYLPHGHDRKQIEQN